MGPIYAVYRWYKRHRKTYRFAAGMIGFGLTQGF
jgi:hypothetical protein